MGEMAAGSAMGAVFRMVVPRLLADMDGIDEEQLDRMLGVLADRLHFVRYGTSPSEAATDADPTSPAAQPGPTTAGLPVSTEG